jgi:hypothetical protein
LDSTAHMRDGVTGILAAVAAFEHQPDLHAREGRSGAFPGSRQDPYSDGGTRPMLNPNIAGASGTWSSDNPAVMYLNPCGYAEALSPGTTWISYVSPDGVMELHSHPGL